MTVPIKVQSYPYPYQRVASFNRAATVSPAYFERVNDDHRFEEFSRMEDGAAFTCGSSPGTPTYFSNMQMDNPTESVWLNLSLTVAFSKNTYTPELYSSAIKAISDWGKPFGRPMTVIAPTESCLEPIDERTYAHAYYPRRGEIHLNGNLKFEGALGERVLLHELGHSLGLTHSDKVEDVMYPVMLNGYSGLSDNDVKRISNKYKHLAELHERKTRHHTNILDERKRNMPTQPTPVTTVKNTEVTDNPKADKRPDDDFSWIMNFLGHDTVTIRIRIKL